MKTSTIKHPLDGFTISAKFSLYPNIFLISFEFSSLSCERYFTLEKESK